MSQINSTTKVHLVGRGDITLRPSDHVATGGEGSVYKAGQTVIKLYTDPTKMVREGMADKLSLLAQIQHPYIVSPSGLVMKNNKPIGYYMPLVEGEGFSKLFTTSFRQREGITDDDTHLLVKRMQEVVHEAHTHKALMVDANELNWLAYMKGKDGFEPRIIDVDSWAVGKWPATVIMPSIQDPHTKGFTELTDWYAWGIVSFQLYTGVHPYKGVLKGYKPAEMVKRMQDNASVFEKDVRLNRAVRDFSCIPAPLLDWYVATFQHGERMIPPSPFDTGTGKMQLGRVARIMTTAQGNLHYEKLFEQTGDPVVQAFSCGVVRLKSGALVDVKSGRTIAQSTSKNCEVISVDKHWLIGEWEYGQFTFTFVNGVSFNAENVPFQLHGQGLFRYADRLFVIADSGLVELSCKLIGQKLLVGAGQKWPALTNSTQWFNGVAVQDTMGSMFMLTPFGDKAFRQVRVRELDGLKVIDAKAGPRFVSLIAVDSQGDYQKLEFAFNADYSSYTLWQGTAETAELNMAVLPKGENSVVATVVEDGELVIHVPANGGINKVSDKDITTDLQLGNIADKVVFVRDGALWRVRMT